MVSSGLLGGMMWILHFVLEFKALERVNLEPIYILFHLGALPFGSLFFLLFSSKHDQKLNYLVSSTSLVLSLIGLVALKDPLLIICCLIIAGFCNGNTVPMIFSLLSPIFKNPEYRGRVFYLVYIGVTVVSILDVVFDLIGNVILHIFYLISLLLIIIITLLIGKEESTLLPRKRSLHFYFGKKIISYPVLLLSFFIGFFMTNVYYTAILIFYNTELTDLMERIPSYWNIFVFVLFFVSLVACIPSGFLYDKIGRRWSILIGFYLEAIAFIAFFLITIFPSLFPSPIDDYFLLLFLPLIAGIGLTLALYGGLLVVLYEQAPEGFLIIHSGIAFLFFGIGMFFGVIIDTALEPLIKTQPVLLPVVMIFAYFTATTVIFQTEEPLPSKEELEWRNKVEHILVLSRSGLPFFSQPLQKQELEADANLAGGAIVGISSIINEITQASNLKVIRHENHCIMIEEGLYTILAVIATEELKTIRNRMIDFVVDFEVFFEDLLEDWRGDTRVFIPAKKLVNKYFR